MIKNLLWSHVYSRCEQVHSLQQLCQKRDQHSSLKFESSFACSEPRDVVEDI